MNAKLTLASFVAFTIALLLTLGHVQGWVSMPETVPAIARWAFVAILAVIGWQRKSLTFWIFFSMVAGAEIGYDFPAFGAGLDIASKIFIKLIKTIIGPLLFATLVIGIAGHSNMAQMGRMGIKSIIYFEVVTTVALVIGLAAINLTRAGDGVKQPETAKKIEISADQLAMSLDSSKAGIKLDLKYDSRPVEVVQPRKKEGWQEIVLHIFPDNIAKSLAEGQVLQIVVFSILFAMGMMLVGDKYKTTMLEFTESLAQIMFKFTDLVMKFAPFAIGGAIAHTIGSMGIEVMKNLGILVLTLYGALVVFILFVFVPLMLWLKIPIKKFFDHVSEPATLAFATASSESALPKALENMEKFGVPRKIVSFVLPTGYSFNLDGSTLYLSLATIFVAQAAGIELPLGQQFLIVLTLMLTSKGVAGVARASLVILAGTCSQFGLPDWPIALILGVDALMDMARTATNLVGNCLATAVIARWEKEGDF